MGAATGDINNDGLPDLYLTNLGANQMYLNKGGGKFVDVTKVELTIRDGAQARRSLITIVTAGWI